MYVARYSLMFCDIAEVIDAYDAKYDWTYDAVEYGQLTEVRPQTIIAWRAAGPAGRDGFVESGKWFFD